MEWGIAGSICWIALSVLMAYLVDRDATRLGVPESRAPGEELHPLFFARIMTLFLAWPISLPYYLYRRSRLLRRGTQ